MKPGNGFANQLSHSPLSPKSLLPVQQSRTFLAKLARKFPASTQSTRPPISPVEAEVPSNQAQTAPLQLTNLPYFVRRTPSNKLPVYLETKAGGTKRLTKIQKTEGDLEALKSDLAKALNLETGSKKPEITINSTTGHIIVKVRAIFRKVVPEAVQLTNDYL
jgi:large subunit ribosomal protein L49